MTIQLYMDGNMACALLGVNLQEGDAVFVSPDDAPVIHTNPQEREKWAITQAYKRLSDQVGGKRLGYYHGSFFCKAYSPFHSEV